MCSCDEVKKTQWVYYKNPHWYDWIVEKEGEPMLFMSTEHSAKYVVEVLNHKQVDEVSKAVDKVMDKYAQALKNLKDR
jgi:hypothetical protein